MSSRRSARLSNVLSFRSAFSSTACNVAVKILSPKFGRLSNRYSKSLHMDWFNGAFKYTFSAFFLEHQVTFDCLYRCR